MFILPLNESFVNVEGAGILGEELKLMVRSGKGNKNRMGLLALEMLKDLRAYWKFHRQPKARVSLRDTAGTAARRGRRPGSHQRDPGSVPRAHGCGG